VVVRAAFLRCSLVGAAVLSVAWCSSPAHAVIVRGDDESAVAAPPADDPGWANVVSVGSATGVYLGKGWVLTAAHVWGSGQTSVLVNGNYYRVQPGTARRLFHPETGAPSDLQLFHLSDPPQDLRSVSISSSAPPPGSTVLGIGNGRNRTADETWWDSNWRPTEPGTPGAYHGFSYAPGNAKRWGVNQLLPGTVLGNDGFGATYMLRTRLDEGGDPTEMQAATGDSGGALFCKRDGNWELAGLILAVSPVRAGQPGGTVVYGDSTYYADLSRYHDQIQAIVSNPAAGDVPEPSSLALLLCLVAGATVWYRWRRARKLPAWKCAAPADP